jgi:hypothetical protein
MKLRNDVRTLTSKALSDSFDNSKYLQLKLIDRFLLLCRISAVLNGGGGSSLALKVTFRACLGLRVMEAAVGSFADDDDDDAPP